MFNKPYEELNENEKQMCCNKLKDLNQKYFDKTQSLSTTERFHISWAIDTLEDYMLGKLQRV